MVFISYYDYGCFFSEINYLFSRPLNFYCDNKVVRKFVNNPIQHNLTNHVELDCHFIKNKLDTKIVTLLFVSLKLSYRYFNTCSIQESFFLNLSTSWASIISNALREGVD